MTNPGYDEGYSQCPRFWGDDPAQAVKKVISLLSKTEPKSAIDLGCGDGKNSAALASAGFRVVAMDKSELAVRNAIQSHGSAAISWLVADMTAIEGPADTYDVVVATGSLHCLSSSEAVVQVIRVMQRLTKPGGFNVVSAFNDGPQDMRGHDTGFQPILLSHSRYVELYNGWKLVDVSDVVQADVHPHNCVHHEHSITRLLAQRAS